MRAKNAKMIPPPSSSEKNGNVLAITAAKTQCVREPNAMPDALTEFGNISEIKTQITEPWPMACDAMKAKI